MLILLCGIPTSCVCGHVAVDFFNQQRGSCVRTGSSTMYWWLNRAENYGWDHERSEEKHREFFILLQRIIFKSNGRQPLLLPTTITSHCWIRAFIHQIFKSTGRKRLLLHIHIHRITMSVFVPVWSRRGSGRRSRTGSPGARWQPSLRASSWRWGLASCRPLFRPASHSLYGPVWVHTRRFSRTFTLRPYIGKNMPFQLRTRFMARIGTIMPFQLTLALFQIDIHFMDLTRSSTPFQLHINFTALIGTCTPFHVYIIGRIEHTKNII